MTVKQKGRYLIDNGQPFKGSSVANTYYTEGGEELVHFSGYLYNEKQGDFTVEQYQAHFPDQDLKIISSDEIGRLLDEYCKSLITSPEEISEDDYFHFLEVLPPCKMQGVDGAQVFHMSEALIYDLVQWNVSKGGKYYCFTNSANLAQDELNTIVNNI
jgi:hypothetical protein